MDTSRVHGMFDLTPNHIKINVTYAIAITCFEGSCSVNDSQTSLKFAPAAVVPTCLVFSSYRRDD